MFEGKLRLTLLGFVLLAIILISTFSFLRQVESADDPTVTPTSTTSSCGGLQQEAESGVLTGNFVVGNETTASGGQFIHLPEGSGSNWSYSTSLLATYCFTVTTPGVYNLKGLVNSPDYGSNGFFVKVNDAPSTAYLWHTNPVGSGFAMDYMSDSGTSADPVELTLAVGEHTITISPREDGTQLDTLELELITPTGATATPAPVSDVCINSGGNYFTASSGRSFLPDRYYTGGQAWPSSPKSVSIANTTDDILHQTERSSGVNLQGFSYEIPVINGDYTVDLYFAEIYYGSAVSPSGSVGGDGPGGERTLSVNLEGGTVELSNYDINADVGPDAEAVKSYSGITVSDGVLEIDFSATLDQPKVSALCVIAEDDPTSTPTPTLSATPTLTNTPTISATNTLTPTPTPAEPTSTPTPTLTSTPTVTPTSTTSSCGGLQQEAEDGVLTGNFVVGNETEASGGQFIHLPEGSGSNWSYSTSLLATYCFTVTSPGVYNLKGVVNSPDYASNGLFVKVNDAPSTAYLWHTNPVGSGFAMDYMSDSSTSADPVELTLAVGEHTITISPREDGTQLDTLELELITPTGATATPAPVSDVCINSGGNYFTASSGRAFLPDRYYTGGQAWPSSPKSVSIANTTDDILHQTERSSGVNLQGFSYEIPVINGDYTVDLYFAEIYYGSAVSPSGSVGGDGPGGERTLSVNLEGGTVELSNYDINADVGPDAEAVKSYSGITVSDGVLEIDFSATLDQPKVSALCVIAEDDPTSTPTPTLTNTPTASPTSTNTPTATATSTSTLTPTPTMTSTITATPTITATTTPSSTPTFTPSPTATITPTITITPTPTFTISNTWQLITPSVTVDVQAEYGFTFDPQLDVAVLYGGNTGGWPYESETWEFDGSTWITVPVTTSLQSVYGMELAYTSAGIIVFGGQDSDDDPVSETAVYDGTDWQILTPSTSPAARTGHAMAYDAVNDTVYVFGGRGGNTYYSDLWSFDPQTDSWSQLLPLTSPSTRRFHTMTYANGKLWLFGGQSASGVLLNDLWSYDIGTNTWSEMTPTGTPPVARYGHGWVYHEQADLIILYGGTSDSGDTLLADTWHYFPASDIWEEKTPSNSPPESMHHTAIYDEANDRIIVVIHGQTWIYQ